MTARRKGKPEPDLEPDLEHGQELEPGTEPGLEPGLEPNPNPNPVPDAPSRVRLDKWLWWARFHPTREYSARRVRDGAIRVNGERVTKAAQQVGVGDVLTFALNRTVRVIRIDAIGERRVSPELARELYTDLEASG